MTADQSNTHLGQLASGDALGRIPEVTPDQQHRAALTVADRVPAEDVGRVLAMLGIGGGAC